MHELLVQFSALHRSKLENFCKTFFDIVTTYNDEICYVKHVLDLLCVFFTLFGCGGGGVPRGVGHTTCLFNFQALAAQKWNFLKLIFSIL